MRATGLAAGVAAVFALVGPSAAAERPEPLRAGNHVPATISMKACSSIPDDYDKDTAKTVYDTAKQRDVDDRVMLATFETAWVESHVNNLDCGDADSLGVFQQRPSQGWGSEKEVQDPEYATNAFLDQAIPNAKNNSGWSAGEVAQSVQRSAYPDRYDEAESKAKDIIAAVS